MVGMSGAFTPYVKLYDGFYFTPEKEPCYSRYKFDKSLHDEHGIDVGVDTESFEQYVQELTEKGQFQQALDYAKIEIVEKEPDPETERMKPIYG